MGNVITLDDLELEGIKGDDGRHEAMIEIAEAFVQSYTGFRFYSFTDTYKLDGTGTEVLTLPQPAVTLTSVKDGDTALVIADDLVNYNRRLPGADDRFWPRLVRKTPGTRFDTFGSPVEQAIWTKGEQNITVAGTFGFTDLVGSAEAPPAEITRVLVQIVRHLIPRVGIDSEFSAARIAKYGIQLAATGGLQVSMAEGAVSPGPTGDPDVDRILRRYRHPRRAAGAPFAFAGA